MAKKRLSPRMGITVPADLREEMEAVGADVNWSQVAAEAFRATVLRIKSRTGGTKMEDVVKRMRAANELEANEKHTEGREAGDLWAKGDATPKQLERLERWVSGLRSFGEDAIELSTRDGTTPDYPLYLAITGEEWDRGEARHFWETVLGDGHAYEQIMDKDFASGFVAGALDVWEQVRGQL